MVEISTQNDKVILRIKKDITIKKREQLSELIRKLPGYEYDRSKNIFTMPMFELKTIENDLQGELEYVEDAEIVKRKCEAYAKDLRQKLIYYNPQNYLTNIDISKDYPYLKIQPRNFQKLAIEWASMKKGMAQIYGGLIADQVGLGKTFQALASICKLKTDGIVNKGVIICPANMKYQWCGEINKFTYETFSIIPSGMKFKKREKVYREFSSTFLVINYEIYLRDCDTILQCAKENANLNFSFIILDEAHKIKNTNSETFKAISKINPKVKLLLTATPIKKDADDLYALMKYLDESILMGWNYFKNKFLIFKKRFGKEQISGIKRENLKFLHYLISPYMIRRKSTDVSNDIPDLEEVFIGVELTKEQARWLNIMEAEMDKALADAEVAAKENKWDIVLIKENIFKSKFRGMIAVADHLELITMSTAKMSMRMVEKYKIKDFTSPKLDMLFDYMYKIIFNVLFLFEREAITSGEKIVIFTQNERMTQIMERDMKREFKEGLGIVKFTGKMSKNCKRMVKDGLAIECFSCKYASACDSTEKSKFLFINDKDTNILLCTDAASAGINLQVARYMFNFDLPFDPGTLEQRGGRIKRMGSPYDKVKIFNLYGTVPKDLREKGCLDENIVGVIKKRRENIEMAVELTAEEKAMINKILET